MPLTPEDVVNKRFNATRVREGYAQEEVDDFLDEVVEELRRLHAENEDLRGKLHGAEQRVGELTRELESRPQPGTAPVAVVEQAPAPVAEEPVAPPAPAPVAQPPVAGQNPVEQAAGMLALAQRLHDEYVREAENQRDRIVSDAQATAERLVTEATAERERTLGQLEAERLDLEVAIGQLRGFEQESRSRLAEYFQNQLEQLRRQATIVQEEAAPDRA
ncbi:DivIVA domain-containing protein [Kineococcus sp. NUM-3379]